MGSIKDNYEIDIIYDTMINQYIGTVEHKILKESKEFNDKERTKVNEKITSYINDLDYEYIKIYNHLLDDVRNNLYKKVSYNKIDWLKVKKEKQIHWQRESKNILYNDYGKPIYYLDVKGSKSKTAPSKIWLAVNSFFDNKAKKELNKNYENNLKQYELFKDEREKWESEYYKYIDAIIYDYENKKEYAVELYYKLFLQNIKFSIDIQIFIDTNILNFHTSKDSITFNADHKILTISYMLPHLDKIWSLIYDKEIEKLGVYRYVTNGRINNRLYQVYHNIIFTFVSHVFHNDKDSDMISSIYFIGNNPNQNHSNIELIISKKEYFSGRPYNFDLLDFISKFNRNKVLFQYLECEGINISHSSKDGRKIIIRETKIDEKIVNILSQFNELESLTLINNDLNEIPTALYNFSTLKKLYIHSNNIKNIPDKIENLKLLEILSLEDNNISNLPNYIFNLKKLRELNFSNNKIEDISIENLEKLISIEKCNLKNNKILSNISNNDLADREIIIELIKLKRNRHIVSKKKILPMEKKSNQINNTPLIITEGKTDWKHLKKALEKFQERGEYLDLDIEFEEFENISMSDSELDDYAQSHAKKINKRRIICIFDRDLPKRVEEYGKNDFVHIANKQYINTLKEKCKEEYGVTSKKYLELKSKLDTYKYQEIDTEIRGILKGKEHKEWETLLKNNVYAFCIPKLSDKLDEICIEFYYKEKDLKKEDAYGKRLFIADEFKFNKENSNNCNRFISKCRNYKTDTQSGKNHNRHVTLQYPNKNDYGYVYKIEEEECHKSNHVNLSKNDFAKNIYNDVEGFDNFDIDNFRLIFDVIERIVND